MALRHTVGIILLGTALAACTSNGVGPSPPSSSEGTESPASYEPDVPAMEVDLEGQIDVKVGDLSDERVVGTRVDCPAEVEWQVGESFRCDVRVPGQKPGYAEVTMETSDGRYSWFISNQ
jgi:hypothetical protein